jgi:hypothetical protein
MTTTIAFTSEVGSAEPRQARNEDLLTDRPTLGIPR